MTKLLYVCLAFTLMAFQCEKRLDKYHNRGNFIASWKQTETWVNPGGGPDIFQPATADNLVLTFNSDGTISSNIDFYKQYVNFKVEDDKKLTLSKAGSADKITIYYTFTSSALKLALPGCIEGCGDVFVVIK